MKKIIIALIAIVLLVLIWKGIQTKPDANIPQATVSNTTSQPSTITETTTVVNTSTEIKTPILSSTKQVDNSKVAIGFTGFGPGKKHVGSFSDIRSNLKTDANSGLSGDTIVGMASLTSDSDKLVTDLKSANFFDVAKYPTATFVLKNIYIKGAVSNKSIVEGKALGAFTIHGVTKAVSFPITQTPTEYKATFTINMKEFGIDQKFANEVVELNIVVPFK